MLVSTAYINSSYVNIDSCNSNSLSLLFYLKILNLEFLQRLLILFLINILAMPRNL